LYLHRTFRYGDSYYWIQDNFNSISIPIYARFDFPTNSVDIFLLAGPRLGLVFDNVSFKDSNGNTGSATLANSGVNNFLFGISLGGGISFNVGIGKMEIGAVYNTVFTQLFPGYEYYSNGIELQLGYGFSLSGNNSTNTSSGSGKSNSW
jgi:hypothetical protein